jgi:flagellar FliJ protein
MAFRFGLETVLKHRKRLEDIAQREYAEAQAAVDRALAQLEAMYTRMDEVRAEIAAFEARGTPDSISMVRSMEEFLGGHKIRIEKARQEARELLLKAEEAQDALITAAQDRKVLVKLKEKKMNEYREKLKRIEAKVQDDQTMVRLAWGKR